MRERRRQRESEGAEGKGVEKVVVEEEIVQRGAWLIFLARPQKQEVGLQEPRGNPAVFSRETGVGIGTDPRPPPACPQADRVGL